LGGCAARGSAERAATAISNSGMRRIESSCVYAIVKGPRQGTGGGPRPVQAQDQGRSVPVEFAGARRRRPPTVHERRRERPPRATVCCFQSDRLQFRLPD
jgi:hypothetical protein